jgi:uncharacterized membrane protein YhhN
MKIAVALLFVVVSLGELIALYMGFGNLHLICKPLIMATLGLYYYTHSVNRSLVVWLAIIFSFAGDTALLFEPKDASFFMIGLGAFLIAHIFYTIAYRQHQDDSDENALRGVQKIRFAFPIVLAGTGLIVVLYPSLGALRIPVVLYALVLIIMVVNAVFRYGRTNSASFGLILGGSILFMTSDSLLAINKFLSPLTSASLTVMSTYILAQFFIIRGLCKHTDFNEHMT